MASLRDARVAGLGACGSCLPGASVASSRDGRARLRPHLMVARGQPAVAAAATPSGARSALREPRGNGSQPAVAARTMAARPSQ
jgi:hypothetical protein